MSVHHLLQNPPGTFTNLFAQSMTFYKDLELIPISTAERDALTPGTGMIIFNETANEFEGYYNNQWNPIGITGSIGPTGPTGNNSQLIFFNAGASQSADNTWITPASSVSNSSTTDFMSCWLFGITGGTISNLVIGCTGDPGSGTGGINIQVWIDGTGTSLSCSMTGTQTSASDNVHTATLGPVPSRLNILCTNKNAPMNMVPIFGQVLYTPN